MKFKSFIMDNAAVNRSLTRISHEIAERNPNESEICLVGVMRRGASIAEILGTKLSSLGVKVNVCNIDVTLYRDDLESAPARDVLCKPEIPFSVADKTVVMVDDVLFTGRTARAAMEAIIANGRPSKIQFAVLVDRGHRELPIVADYVGKNVPTSRSEVIVVKLPPFDDEVSVAIWQKD